MKLIRVKRPGEVVWHFALESEIRPVCACMCVAPGVPKKRGLGNCVCFCHKLGCLRTLSLCEKLAKKNGDLFADIERQMGLLTANELKAVKRQPWKTVIGRGSGCQTCARLGAKFTKADVEWLRKELYEE